MSLIHFGEKTTMLYTIVDKVSFSRRLLNQFAFVRGFLYLHIKNVSLFPVMAVVFADSLIERT